MQLRLHLASGSTTDVAIGKLVTPTVSSSDLPGFLGLSALKNPALMDPTPWSYTSAASKPDFQAVIAKAAISS